MKKLALILTLVLSTSVFLSAFAGPIITIKVRIGKANLDCAKFGLCPQGSSVGISGAKVANGTPDGTTLQINDNTGMLEITVPANIWKEKAEYFNSTSVVFDEAIPFGKKLSTDLSSSTEIIIKAGKYNVKKDRLNNVVIYVPIN